MLRRLRLIAGCMAITLTYAIVTAGSWRPEGGHGVSGFLCAACSLLLVSCWMLVVGSSVLYSYLRYVPYSLILLRLLFSF